MNPNIQLTVTLLPWIQSFWPVALSLSPPSSSTHHHSHPFPVDPSPSLTFELHLSSFSSALVFLLGSKGFVSFSVWSVIRIENSCGDFGTYSAPPGNQPVAPATFLQRYLLLQETETSRWLRHFVPEAMNLVRIQVKPQTNKQLIIIRISPTLDHFLSHLHKVQKW